MASWSTPVVGSPSTRDYATPLVNFDAIANLGKDYYAGKDMAAKDREQERQEEIATAFRSGIPKTGAGDPNYSAMSERMLQLGAFPTAITLQNTGLELQRQKNGQTASDQWLSPATGAPQPAAAPARPSPQPQSVPAQPRPQAGAPQGDAPGSIVSVVQGTMPDELAGPLIGQLSAILKVDPNAPLNESQTRAAQAYLKRQAGGGQPQPAAAPVAQETPATAATPTQRISQGFTDAGVGQPAAKELPATTQRGLQSRLDALPPSERKALLSVWATSPAFPKSMNEFAEKRLAAIERNEEPTTEIKNVEYDNRNGGRLTTHEASLAGAKEAATAPYKIAANAIREGARPVAIKPNEVITTGAQVDPALTAITNWATRKMGAPVAETSAPAPAAPALPPAAPTGSQPPALPHVPSPPVAPGNTPPPSTQSGRSAFTPQMVRNPDGSVASSVTPSTEALQKDAAQNYEKARETYAGAQEVQGQLAGMDEAARTLNQANWSKVGQGGNARLQLAKTVNSIWQTIGVKDQDLPFNPDSVASWEKLTKETTRLGFGLARTLGAREAMQIVQGAIKANPNAENTPLGFRMVLNSIRQNAERQTDYYTFATEYAQSHGGDLVGADVAFNKLNPPQLYARRAIVQAQKDIPFEAIEHLRSDPSSAAAFDQHYGSKGLAKMFLGNARAQ